MTESQRPGANRQCLLTHRQDQEQKLTLADGGRFKIAFDVEIIPSRTMTAEGIGRTSVTVTC